MRHSSERRRLMEAALKAEQPCCSRCSSWDMQPEAAAASVLYIGIDLRFELAVPRYSCRQSGCGGTFAPSPFTIGCFPATPKASWDVSRSGPAHPARWIDLRLLQLADGLIFHGARTVAVYTFAAVVHQQHELNGCSEPPLAWEHFKRQLGEAIMVRSGRGGGWGPGQYVRVVEVLPCPVFLPCFASCKCSHSPELSLPASLFTLLPPAALPCCAQEYGYLMCAVMELIKLGVQGIPTGPLSCCPCCADARPLHSLNVDFNFSLCHFAHCASATVREPPPNHNLFLHGQSVSELMRAANSDSTAAQADADRACSDFDAARALSRTSDKVCGAGRDMEGGGRCAP